ncbi:helix-turn-helix domain-containing protein [Plantactinospora sp. WMMB782]|uniref:helix-turn-helix domain-containing protein n=1 Tax=Plantactinospora sp. WMMB782 TaxID=3404121 RepID=UPI003B948C8F
MAHRLLKVQAAAALLDASASTVYRLVYAGRLSAVPIGTGKKKPRIRIKSDELDQLMRGER